jgi:hypothetical protein
MALRLLPPLLLLHAIGASCLSAAFRCDAIHPGRHSPVLVRSALRTPSLARTRSRAHTPQLSGASLVSLEAGTVLVAAPGSFDHYFMDALVLILDISPSDGAKGEYHFPPRHPFLPCVTHPFLPHLSI